MSRVLDEPGAVAKLSPLYKLPLALNSTMKVLLIIPLFIYLMGGLATVYFTPVLESAQGNFINAPDESAHREYVRIVATERRLPIQGETTYEWHQPPMYYLTAAIISPLGIWAVRCWTLILGLISLLVAFRSVRLMYPDEPYIALTTVTLMSLLPMRQAIYGAVTNDAAIELVFVSFLYYAVLIFRSGLSSQRATSMGILIGLGMMTKANATLLIPLALVLLIVLKRAGETISNLIRSSIIIFAVIVTIVAPWYARNYQLYGEATLIKSFTREFEHTQKATDWIGTNRSVDMISGSIAPSEVPMSRTGYEALLGNWTARTFLGSYSTVKGAAFGIPRFMQANFYVVYLCLGIAGIVGVLRRKPNKCAESTMQKTLWLTMSVMVALVVLSFGGFTWIYFQAQGRYLYPALLPITLFIATGLTTLLKNNPKRLIIGLLVLLSVLDIAFISQGVIANYSATSNSVLQSQP